MTAVESCRFLVVGVTPKGPSEEEKAGNVVVPSSSSLDEEGSELVVASMTVEKAAEMFVCASLKKRREKELRADQRAYVVVAEGRCKINGQTMEEKGDAGTAHGPMTLVLEPEEGPPAMVVILVVPALKR